jgi:hypothetical protein
MLWMMSMTKAVGEGVGKEVEMGWVARDQVDARLGSWGRRNGKEKG